MVRPPSTLLLLFFMSLSARAADHKPPPAKPAAQYAAFDVHPAEHVTIAAEPCDDPKACPFFRLPYIQHGFLPIRVIVSNDGDRALSLDDARIQFISANRDTIPAATDEDIHRRLFDRKSGTTEHIPLVVVPLSIPIHHKPVDKKILEDAEDTGFQGTIVNAHSSLDGYLFYDIRGLDDPAAKNAELYLKMIHTLDGKQELFAFTISLNPWLAARPAPVPGDPARK
jgi:hypothetical protein